MFNKTITVGTRQVVISGNSEQGPFSSRLYVNNGKTATLQVKKAATLKGAEKQAYNMLLDGLRWSEREGQYVPVAA